MADQPNVLVVMTDQQRFDIIAALGHDHVDERIPTQNYHI